MSRNSGFHPFNQMIGGNNNSKKKYFLIIFVFIFIFVFIYFIFIYFQNKNKETETENFTLFPEGYPIPTSYIWDKNIINAFNKFQQIHNPYLRFDLDIIQKQASEEEVKELIKNSKWKWSQDIQDIYKQYIAQIMII